MVVSITGTIRRTSSEGDLVNISNIGYYKEVLAYDWESDNTTGTLPIRGNINSNKICPIAGNYNDSTCSIVNDYSIYLRSPLY